MRTAALSRRWVYLLTAALVPLLLPLVQAEEPQSQPAPEKPYGWRGDGTGHFPEAAPVTTWSAKENVVWACKLPGDSNASPTLAGDRVFVCSEPDVLVCVAKADGKILWQHANPVLETYPEAERANIQAGFVKLEGALKERDELRGKLPALRRISRTNPEARKEFEAAQTRVRELDEKLAEAEKLLPPRTDKENGHASPTPVTDGKHVYICFNNGVTACYALDGTRRWIKFIEKPFHAEWGHSASPVLAGGLLLIHYKQLKALNPGTGEVKWAVDAAPSFGTPVVAAVGNTPVLITPVAEVVRVSDGKILGKGRVPAGYAYSSPANSPVVVGQRVYFADEGGAFAYELPAEAGDTLELKQLWKSSLKRVTHYASPLVHDGLLYALSKEGELIVLDAATGAPQGNKSFKETGHSGTFYPSLTLAGKLLYLANENGRATWLEPGKEFKEAGRNVFEFARSTPVFAGSRMFLRTKDHLYCIGK